MVLQKVGLILDGGNVVLHACARVRANVVKLEEVVDDGRPRLCGCSGFEGVPRLLAGLCIADDRPLLLVQGA